MKFKNQLASFLIGCLSLTGYAQSDSTGVTSEKAEAGIYNLSFRMSEKLREESKVTNPDRKVLNSMSTMESFPEAILDSIRTSSERFMQTKLDEKVTCVYKYNKKGKKIESIGVNGTLEGMPVNTFSKAVEQDKLDHYISISATFDAGGVTVDLGPKKKSKIKPKLTLRVKVVDSEKNEVYSDKITLKDFGKLRAVETKNKNLIVRESETLSPADFLTMYELAFTRLLAQEK